MAVLEQTAPGPAAASPGPSGAAISPRIRRLLEGPVLPTLLRLALPNLGEAVARVAFITLDAYFVGWLGYDALAGASLVFPLLLLMQTMAAAAMGSGISSAIARALGGGRIGDANALVMHAVAIGLGMSGLFALIFLPTGPALYAAMGGVGLALEAATTYSTVLFLGGVFIWMMNTLANVLRGTGNMVVPASAIVIAELVHVTLSPMLILGLGPLPRLGVAGAALAVVLSYLAGTLVLLAYLGSGRAIVRFSWTTLQWQWRLFADILKVGALSSLNALQAQVTYIALAALIGHFGTTAIAGLGAALRLEQVQFPITFAFGSAVVAMVGANMGAGHRSRATRIAWTGAVIGAAIGGIVGFLGAVFAPDWIGWFSAEPAVVTVGSQYLRVIGPSYPFLGLGLILFAASQGFGKVAGTFLCSTSRLIIITVGGWLMVDVLHSGLNGLFAVAAAAMVVLGISNAAVFKWRVTSPVAAT
jgi:putative MATE family efflux protein